MDEPFRSQLETVWEELRLVEDQIRSLDDFDDEDAVDLYGEIGRISKLATQLQKQLKPRLVPGATGDAFHVTAKRRSWRTYNFGGLMRLANDHGLTFQDLWVGGYLRVVMSAKGFKDFLDRVGIPMERAMATHPFAEDKAISAGPAKAQFVRADPDRGLLWIDQLEPQLVVAPNSRPVAAEVEPAPLRAVAPDPSSEVAGEEEPDEQENTNETYEDDWQTLAEEISRDLADDADDFARSTSEGWFYED